MILEVSRGSVKLLNYEVAQDLEYEAKSWRIINRIYTIIDTTLQYNTVEAIQVLKLANELMNNVLHQWCNNQCGNMAVLQRLRFDT